MNEKKEIEEICRYLDHSVLKPEMTLDEVTSAIQMGIDYHVGTVCVRPCDIELAVGMCKDTDTKVCTVLSFPHGLNPSKIKALEATEYIAMGADEIDMVTNYSYIRSGKWEKVESDIRAVTEIARPAGIIVKVIFETSQLTLDEVRKTTKICISAGADFVKTSTGFYGEGATEEVVQTMLDVSNGRIMVKPSGGIRDKARAEMFIKMGVHRLGSGYASLKAICDGSGAESTDSY